MPFNTIRGMHARPYQMPSPCHLPAGVRVRICGLPNDGFCVDIGERRVDHVGDLYLTAVRFKLNSHGQPQIDGVVCTEAQFERAWRERDSSEKTLLLTYDPRLNSRAFTADGDPSAEVTDAAFACLIHTDSCVEIIICGRCWYSPSFVRCGAHMSGFQ